MPEVRFACLRVADHRMAFGFPARGLCVAMIFQELLVISLLFCLLCLNVSLAPRLRMPGALPACSWWWLGFFACFSHLCKV